MGVSVDKRAELPDTPSGRGADGRHAWLCGTCLANVTVYQRLVEEEGGTMPWALAREFRTRLRLLIDGRPRRLDQNEVQSTSSE